MVIRAATELDRPVLFELVSSFPSPSPRTAEACAHALGIKLTDESVLHARG